MCDLEPVTSCTLDSLAVAPGALLNGIPGPVVFLMPAWAKCPDRKHREAEGTRSQQVPQPRVPLPCGCQLHRKTPLVPGRSLGQATCHPAVSSTTCQPLPQLAAAALCLTQQPAGQVPPYLALGEAGMSNPLQPQDGTCPHTCPRKPGTQIARTHHGEWPPALPRGHTQTELRTQACDAKGLGSLALLRPSHAAVAPETTPRPWPLGAQAEGFQVPRPQGAAGAHWARLPSPWSLVPLPAKE